MDAVTDTLRVATVATNHDTRHPAVTATWATTMHRSTPADLAPVVATYSGAEPRHD